MIAAAEDTIVVVDALSRIALRFLSSLGSEQRYPMGDSDGSDEKMADAKTTIKALRRIREEFENLMTGAFL